MTLTKDQVITYLIDCLGYSDSDTIQEVWDNDIKDVLSKEELEECIEFSK